jgi:hypothetical protein
LVKLQTIKLFGAAGLLNKNMLLNGAPKACGLNCAVKPNNSKVWLKNKKTEIK